MFKNEIIITQSYILSKQEKKEVCKMLTKSYDAKHVDYILKNFQNLSFHKISGSKKRLLFNDNLPIFFEFDNDVFYPTIYLLNLLPNFMKDKKCYIYDETDSFLANGADLMLKGVLNREEIKKNLKFRLNDIFCVETRSGNITMLGETLVSWNIMNTNIPGGKFLKNIHRIDDSLWNLGNKKIPKKLIVPELEMPIKSKINESEVNNIMKRNQEESKQILNSEFIEIANKVTLYSNFDMNKINFLSNSKEGLNAFQILFEKINLFPLLDYFLKIKILQEKKDDEIKENKNNEDEEDCMDNDENEEDEEIEEGEVEKNFNIENHKYLNPENLEFFSDKLNILYSFIENIEEELNKIEKTKDEKIEILKDSQNLNNENTTTENLESENINKKLKQHRKKHNKENKCNLTNVNDKNTELIDISHVLIVEEEKNEIDKINKLKSEYLKSLNLLVDYEIIKTLKNLISKLSEMITFVLILIKTKIDPNFINNPKFFSLMLVMKKFIPEENKTNNENLSEQTKTENLIEKEVAEESEILSKITPEEMDENINTILFTSLKLVIIIKKDEIFPLDPGKLLREYLKPLALELDLPFDFRYSSHKKINNYLKYLSKNEGLLVFSKPKGMQNDYILSVNWQNEKLTKFIPPIKKVIYINKQVVKEEERENVILSKDEKIELVQMFKPNQNISDIFKKLETNYDSSNFYPITKCNAILTSYLKLNNLFSIGTGEIIINQELKDKIFKKTDKKIGDKIKMDEMFTMWRKNLNEKDIITKTSGENTEVFKTTKGNSTCKIRIIAKKLCNKNVTIVDGLNFFVDLKDITKTFSKHFACSVSIKPFQNTEEAVFIQGYWVYELVEILQNELKLNKSFIVIEDKLKLKKK